MKVLLCINRKKEKTAEVLPFVLKKLKSYGFEVIYEQEDISKCDLVITVGGDGTILKWGKIAARAKKPLLGINTGTLGFMATLEHNELHRLEQLSGGHYRISRRMMLDVALGGNSYLALNDVVIKRSVDAKLPEFHLSGAGVEVSRIRADGVVFSTATGSTAYALSAGGPILEPELSCIEFTPLCAHTLFGRSMIFTGNNALELTYKKFSMEDAVLSVDGDRQTAVGEDCVVEIKKSQLYLDIIDISKNSFYDSVHNKLMRPLK